MYEALLTIATVAAISLGSPPVAAASDDGPVALAEGFVQAWNKHDGRLFGDLFANDADWVTVAGLRVKTRAQIQAFLEREHATWAKTTTMGGIGTEVRSLGKDVAVVHFSWEISGAADRDGKPTSPYRGVTLLVATREPARGWKIVAGQVSRETGSGIRSTMPPNSDLQRTKPASDGASSLNSVLDGPKWWKSDDAPRSRPLMFTATNYALWTAHREREEPGGGCFSPMRRSRASRIAARVLRGLERESKS